MAFSFGFSGADVGEDVDVDPSSSQRAAYGNQDGAQAGSAPAIEHSLAEMLATLPDRLSYSTVRVESPIGRILQLPRRELYDVRVQLMAEDDAGNDETLKDLDKSDIRSGVYEGGFKTWECSLDLASLLLDRGPRKDIDELVRCDQVVELGCGTALPTLVLFQHALQNDMSLAFTLQDYNDTVLRLVTLPNLLLTWAAYQPTPLIDVSQPHGDLEISPETLQAFQSSLAASSITLKFLSGSWSPDMAPLITQSAPDMGTVVLGAETIYSPASTAAFVSLLMELLRRVKMAKAMVAAKKIYFGVGGSVDGLKEACREQGAVAYEIENHGVPGLDGGVGRALVEIQMY